MFTSIYINDYCNFRKFRLDIPEKQESDLNLNILIGKNGSGKSCLLDALYCIAKNNLLNKTDKNVDNTKFDYEILLKDKTIIENPKQVSSKYLTDEEIKKHLWHNIIRLYTGSTDRKFDTDYNSRILSIGPEDTKWALLTSFLAGQWTNPTSIEEELWNKVEKIVLGYNPDSEIEDIQQIKPKIIWVDLPEQIEAGSNAIFADDFYDWEMPAPTVNVQLENGNYRYFWSIDQCTKLKGEHPEEDRIFMFDMLNHLLELHEEERLIDTGFLYTQNNEELLPSEYLSDGEFALLARFSVLMIARELDKKTLILLDEPETHFNEYWKTWFLQLVCETLKDSKHDIFIATHSAMLLTDAKRNELLRLEAAPDGIRQKDINLLTYGANIVDIGKILFQMESDIGIRAQNDIENIIKGKNIKTGKTFRDNEEWKTELHKLLKQVGPGEWRWRIRSKINQLEKTDLCCNFIPKAGDKNDS